MTADLRLLRARLGLSQAEAAALCCVQDRTWRRWERGEYLPADALAPCHALLAQQDRAVAEALAQHEALTAEHGRPDLLALAWSADDAVARERGWPSAGAWLAVIRRVAEATGVGVRVIAPD